MFIHPVLLFLINNLTLREMSYANENRRLFPPPVFVNIIKFLSCFHFSSMIFPATGSFFSSPLAAPISSITRIASTRILIGNCPSYPRKICYDSCCSSLHCFPPLITRDQLKIIAKSSAIFNLKICTYTETKRYYLCSIIIRFGKL